MKLLIKIIFISNILFINHVYAVCVIQGNITPANIYANMGLVVVNPNLKVGDIIAQQSWTIPRVERAFYCGEGDLLYADVVMANLTNYSDKIFTTNIPGVGIQFKRNDNIYPYTFTTARAAYISVAESSYTVILYKIAEHVGSGPIKSGLYTIYTGAKSDYNSAAVLTYINENGTTIVAPSCSVSGGIEQNIYLPSVSTSQLNTIGATAGDTPFSIQLQCSGGASLNVGYDDVNLTFSGTPPEGMTNSQGVLINDNTSLSAAQSVGIQILDNTKQPLIFDKKYPVGSLAINANNYSIINNFIARYYRYGKKIKSGKIEAKMVFNITYD